MGSNFNQKAASNALALNPARLPEPVETKAFNLQPGQWKVLTEAIFPSAKTVDGVMMALAYCKSRNLDVFKRAVHIVPMYSSTLGRDIEGVWPGIGEMRTTAHRTGVYAGMDECVFGEMKTKLFKDKAARGQGQNKYVAEEEAEATYPESAQITVYKIVAGIRCAFPGPRVSWEEAFSGVKGLRVPNSKWIASPKWMIEKCAEAAALRRAFPEEIGNEYSAEEMEGKVWNSPTGAVVVEATEVDTSKAKPTRESSAEAPPANQVNFIAEVEGFCATVPNEADIDFAVTSEKEMIDSLAPVLRKRFDDAIAKARDRLAVEADEARRSSVQSTGQSTAKPAAAVAADTEIDAGDDDRLDEQEPAYVGNVRRDLSEMITLEEINSYVEAENSFIQGQPDHIRTKVDALIQARRDDLDPEE